MQTVFSMGLINQIRISTLQTLKQVWKADSLKDTATPPASALKDTGVLDKLAIMKPYSFVLVDEDRETVTELLLIDDEDTLLLNDELLKGLDEELDAFLKDLLEK